MSELKVYIHPLKKSMMGYKVKTRIVSRNSKHVAEYYMGATRKLT